MSLLKFLMQINLSFKKVNQNTPSRKKPPKNQQKAHQEATKFLKCHLT